MCPSCGSAALVPRAGIETGGDYDERWWHEWWQCRACGAEFEDNEISAPGGCDRQKEMV